ncbi:Pancreatic lipase-related protein 2 [Halotydeus destructor]|nr:Pancreatic lipase-related protein 2 [Halotydeus destructor]
MWYEPVASTIQRQEGAPTNPVTVPLFLHHRLLGFLSVEEEPMLHIGNEVNNITEIGTKFLWYEKESEEPHWLDYTKWIESIPSLTFEPDKIVFITHGFQEEIWPMFDDLKNSILNLDRHVVITVDWQNGASSGMVSWQSDAYERACVNTMIVGREVALVGYLLVSTGIITKDKIHLIGQGLGAHVMHFAGEYFKILMDRDVEKFGGPRRQGRVGRITGLDPMARDFQGFGNPSKPPYLNREDADFVDIIHTSTVSENGFGDDLAKSRYGMSVASGHVDFYPNGGQEQPYCGGEYKCSHRRALQYFIKSLDGDADTRNMFMAYYAENYKAYLADHRPSSFSGSFSGSVSQTTSTYSLDDIMIMGIAAEKKDWMDKVSPNPFFLDVALDEDMNFMPISRDASIPDVKMFETFVKPVTSNQDGYVFSEFPSHDTPIPVAEKHAADIKGCGRFLAPPSGYDGRVHFGLQSYVRQFPWLVCLIAPAVRKDASRTIYYKQTCTGTLISDEFIITAAHCFGKYGRGKTGPIVVIPGFPLYLAFGIDCKRPIVMRTVSIHAHVTLFIHPEYVRDKPLSMTTFDVALVKLVDPIEHYYLPQDGVFTDTTKLNVLCWRDAPEFDYEICPDQLYFAGYGVNVLPSKSNDHLQWTVKRIRPPGAEPAHVFESVNSEAHRLRNPCPGDSGGPYMHFVDHEDANVTGADARLSRYTVHLVGTHMGGNQCNLATRVSTAAKLGHRGIYDWVDMVVSRYSRSAMGAITAPPRNARWVDLYDFLEDF